LGLRRLGRDRHSANSAPIALTALAPPPDLSRSHGSHNSMPHTGGRFRVINLSTAIVDDFQLSRFREFEARKPLPTRPRGGIAMIATPSARNSF
jgi:hypothetical protein